MTKEEKKNTLHCLKVMIDEEVCEECDLYGTTGTDHCEADCVRVAIKALEQEPCCDAISRQAVLEYIEKSEAELGHDSENELVCQDIKALPPVTPKPKTGRWIEVAKYSDGKHKIECSECGSHIFDRGHANSFNVRQKYKYCPNCGAKMFEPQESEDK